MSVIDVFAAVILIVLIATAVAVFVAMGMAPGYIAKSRNHPWAQAVEVAGWATPDTRQRRHRPPAPRRSDRHGRDFHGSRQGGPYIIRRVMRRMTAILSYVNPF
jgi:hypothetical protein